MTHPATCRTCGRPLPADHRSGDPCPSCLLALGAEPEVFHTRGPAPAEPPPLEEVQRLFSHLDIEKPIGMGGMGVVYLARQRRLDRPVALKILDRELAAEPGFAERFEREARAMARLSHPSIVHVYDFGETEGVFWLLMEYVEGVNLRQRQAVEPLEPEQALWLVPQICDALQYAHELGVVHRDIKPENILLDLHGNVKLADFGLAKLVKDGPSHPTLTRASQVMGTPQYMAPEQRKQPLEVDHRADIYSLGIVLYEMLTGELPVGRFPLPSEQPGVDPRLDEVVLKAMEREPSLRYQKVSEVGTDVEQLGAQPPTPGRSRPSGAAWSPPPAGPTPAPADTEDVPRLRWMDQGLGGPRIWGAGALGLALLWSVFVIGQRQVHDIHETLTISYCLAFLAWVAARSLAESKAWLPWVLGLRAGAGVVGFMALTILARRHYPFGASVPVEMLATMILLGTQVLLDRWVRQGRWALGAGAFALLIVATILHASAGHSQSTEAYYYSTGMLALLSVSSLLVRLPEYFNATPDPRHGQALLRALPVALFAAILYFHEYIMPN